MFMEVAARLSSAPQFSGIPWKMRKPDISFALCSILGWYKPGYEALAPATFPSSFPWTYPVSSHLSKLGKLDEHFRD